MSRRDSKYSKTQRENQMNYKVIIMCDAPFYVFDVEADSKEEALELGLEMSPSEASEVVPSEGLYCEDTSYAVPEDEWA
jgi:hypothetical protein